MDTCSGAEALQAKRISSVSSVIVLLVTSFMGIPLDATICMTRLPGCRQVE